MELISGNYQVLGVYWPGLIHVETEVAQWKGYVPCCSTLETIW
jgi:hypothetical protein